MRKMLLVVAFMFVSSPAYAQFTAIACTDATNTVCSVKKNQPFNLTNDAASPTDTIPTEKWQLYLDGVKVKELDNTGVAPVYAFPAGLSQTGQHTLFAEAVATVFDANGQPQLIASGPSNVVTLTVVTGSLSAPKNLKIGGGGQ